jgi:hypothetical protein
MDYSKTSTPFWITIIGHEAMSVLSLIETKKSISGTQEQVIQELKLRSSKLDVLKLLLSFDLISMNKSKKMYTIFSTGTDDVPAWGQFVQCLSESLSKGGIKKGDVQKINWEYVFSQVDAATVDPVRVGLGKLETIEIINRSDMQKPRLLVNGNQRPNGNGFSFVEIIRGDFICMCSHKIGDSANVSDSPMPLKISLKPAVIEPEIRSSDLWQTKEEGQWNATDLSGWIIHRFSEVYDAPPPFNMVDVQRAGILTNGAYALARMKRIDEASSIVEYKQYVEWLLDHKTFDLTMAALTSQRMLGIFCVDQLKSGKKPTNAAVGIPEGQNIQP